MANFLVSVATLLISRAKLLVFWGKASDVWCISSGFQARGPDMTGRLGPLACSEIRCGPCGHGALGSCAFMD